MFCSNQAGNNPGSDYNYTAVLKEYNVKNKSVFAPVKNIYLKSKWYFKINCCTHCRPLVRRPGPLYLPPPAGGYLLLLFIITIRTE